MPCTYGRRTYGTVHIVGGGIVTVGNFCSIAGDVKAITVGHNIDWVTTFPFSSRKFRKLYRKAYNIKGHPVVYEIKIGNDVWIGQGVTFVGNCEVENGAIIGAGSVVRGLVEAYSINFGNPSKKIAMRFAPDQITKLQRIKWWEWEDSRIQDNMELLLSNNVEEFICTNLP